MSKKKSANAKQETPGEILQRLDEEAEARVRVVDDTEEAALKQAASTTPENKEDSATKEVDEISKKAFEKTTVTDNSGEHSEDDALKINPAPMLKTDIDAMLGKGKKKKKGEKKETKGQKRVQAEAQKPKTEPEKKPETLSNGEAIQKYMTQKASVEELKAALKMAEEREAVERDIAIATGTATPEQCKAIVVVHHKAGDMSAEPEIMSETFSMEFVKTRNHFKEMMDSLKKNREKVLDYSYYTFRKVILEYLDAYINYIDKVCLSTKNEVWLKAELDFQEHMMERMRNESTNISSFLKDVHVVRDLPSDIADNLAAQKAIADIAEKTYTYVKTATDEISYKHNLPDKIIAFAKFASRHVDFGFSDEIKAFNEELHKKLCATA